LSSEEKNEDSNTEKHDSEAGAQDSIDATSKEGDGEPEVIIVEEEVEDDSSNTDMVTEIVIESYAEFNDKVDDQTDINRIYSEKIGVESEDPNGHTIVDSGSVKDQVTNDNAESNYHFDDNAMTAEDSKHPGYRDKHSGHHENEDGGGEYQSMPVDEMPDQEAPVEEENNIEAADLEAQEDDTPPGTPEQGPESNDSLLVFKPLSTANEPNDSSTPTSSNKSKSRSLIMSSALEEEVSQMEQLDFEEDHLLIFPELDEKQALDAAFEEQAEDKKAKVKAKELSSRKGSSKETVTAERLVGQ
jgi:hypothetical protein